RRSNAAFVWPATRQQRKTKAALFWSAAFQRRFCFARHPPTKKRKRRFFGVRRFNAAFVLPATRQQRNVSGAFLECGVSTPLLFCPPPANKENESAVFWSAAFQRRFCFARHPPKKKRKRRFLEC